MADYAAGIIIGVLTGLCSSALFWWMQAKVLRPKIVLCPTLSKYRTSDASALGYQFKIINQRRRPAANLIVSVRILMPGLVRKGSIEVLPIARYERFWLDGRKTVKFNVHPDEMSEQVRRSYQRYFSAEMRESLQAGVRIDLLGLLELCPGSTVSIGVSAEDVFSGARCFVRTQYRSLDISMGRFQGGTNCQCTGVLQLEPDGDGDVNAANLNTNG